MIIDFIPIRENGVSIRLPRIANALRVFLVFRATQTTAGVTSGGVVMRAARDVGDHGGRVVHASWG